MQSFFIFLAIFLGLLLPAGHHLTFLIRYFLMGMLFLAFLQIDFNWKIIQKNHFKVLALNLVLPSVFYIALRPFDTQLALAVFVMSIAPTAAVAPVIAGFLKTKITFVTTSVVLTSPVIALVLPALLPLVLSVDKQITTLDVLFPVALVIFTPLIASSLVKRFFPQWLMPVLRYRGISFYFFLFNVFIGSAQSSYFVRHDYSGSWATFLLIGLSVALLCIIQFQIGGKLGNKEERMETSLALGRKNTMFGLWVALTFIDPVVALGPMFYIVFQNIYNSWQLWRMERKT